MSTYEPCVLGSDGNCTRWSHDHAADRLTDTTGVQVGDPDPWTGDYDMCEARLESAGHLTCTAPRGHTGPHTASDGDYIVAVDPARPTVTDNARAVREAAMNLYRALRRTNPDALAEVDEVEDWTYWENIVRAAQVALAADRPSVTDNARAEAMRRYPSDIADRGLTYPTGAVREHSRAAFVAGAEWAAGRAETTTATTEDAARVLDDVIQHLRKIWSTGHDEAREVIDTAEELLAQALPRLLATARTRPTRDDLAHAIASGYETDHPTPNRHDYRAADAVLALLQDGAR